MLDWPGRVVRFDLESPQDRQRLTNPELVLGVLDGLVVIDEIQVMPELFRVLRVLVDSPACRARFLLLGSASPAVVRGVSESLAGRVERVEIAGFDLSEVGEDTIETLWVRGSFPRSYLAANDEDSAAWREDFVRTFLERDIPQLGISIPAPAMRRFWTMLAHSHGQTWNAAELARSMGLSDRTVRSYLDILTGTFMVRQLQPWYVNIGKRQVKAPKVYFRDPGILHTLLALPDRHSLLGHPRVGASWEGFALEQVLRALEPTEGYFWSTHGGAEVDLLATFRGRRHGFEMKWSETPTVTRSMRIALEELELDHLWIVHPGRSSFEVDDLISAWSLRDLAALVGRIHGATGAPA